MVDNGWTFFHNIRVATFTPLWSTLVTSTVWQTSKETRLVWITLLAMKDRDGVVQSSVPGLAHMANVTIPECERALEELMAPDQYSRTKTNEGRRVARVDGGWCILNHAKYRNLMADRREYWREAKKKSRLRNSPHQARERQAAQINENQPVLEQPL